MIWHDPNLCSSTKIIKEDKHLSKILVVNYTVEGGVALIKEYLISLAIKFAIHENTIKLKYKIEGLIINSVHPILSENLN